MPTDAIAALTDVLPEPTLVVEEGGRIAAANRAFTRTFGWSASDVIGRPLLDLVADPPEAVGAYLRRAAGTRQLLVGALGVRHRDGSVIACRSEGGVLEPRSAAGGARLLLRIVRREAGVLKFAVLTRRIGDLTAEVARRRRAELEAAGALREQVALQQRLSALADAAGELLAEPSPVGLLANVGMLGARLLPAPAHAIWRAMPDAREWRIVWHRQLSDAFVETVAAAAVPDERAMLSEPQLVPDVRLAPALAHRLPSYEQEGIRSVLVVPLSAHGQPFGTFVAYFTHPASFSEADRHVAHALGSLASAALTTASLYEQEAQSRREAERAEWDARFLARASAALASSLDYEQALQTVAALLVPEFADWCTVDIAVDHGGPRRVAAVSAAHAEAPPADARSAAIDQVAFAPDALHVLRSGEAVLVGTAPDPAGSLVSLVRVPLRAGGRVLGVLSFGRPSASEPYTEAELHLAEDVASRAALAVENAHAYAEATRANRLKDEFLATLSHELRTPLNAILGYVRMLRSGIIPPGRQPRALEIVDRNASALSQIVEDVLDVSRIVSGKIRLNVQQVDLPRVLQEAIATVQPAADARRIRLSIIIDPRATPIAGDPDRLQQVAWNLLSNAVKFTPKGGRVQLVLQRINSHVELVVSDTGIGIGPEFLPYVFDRFRQEDSRYAREHGGLGLGLAITRHIVESHGGRIRVETPGHDQGTTFRVELPLLGVDRAAPPSPGVRVHPTASGPAEPAPLAGRLDGVHVLAVDDDADALSLLREVLEAAGARVTAATSGGEALRLLDTAAPDVLVADIGMPGTDGFTLMQGIRASAPPGVRDLPAAALTAYARSEDRIKALQSGFQMHLAKPINPSELVEAVNALARSRNEPPAP